MRLVRLFAALAVTGSVLVFGSARAETLMDALQSAHMSNPKLNAERARMRAEAERAPQSFAKLLPSVTGDVSAGRNDMSYSTSGTSRYSPSGAGVTVTAPLFDGFKTLNDYRSARADVTANDARLLAIEAQILTQATMAFVNVIRDRKTVLMRRDNLSSLNESLTQVEGRVRAGDISRTNIDQTRARVYEAQADLEQALANLADSEANYQLYVGHAPGQLTPPRLTRLVLPRSVQEALAVAERENPNVAAAVHSRRAADYAVDSAKGAFLPTLGFEGSYRRGYEENQIAGASLDNTSVKLRLGVPLFDGGTNISRLRQAKEALNQRDLEIDDASASARKIVSSSFETQRRAALRKQAAANRVAAAEAALKGLMIEFNGGQLPLINVLDGRRELINARVTVAAAEADEVTALAQLLGALGRLDVGTIGAMTAGRTVNAVAPRSGGGRVSDIKTNEPRSARSAKAEAQAAPAQSAAESEAPAGPAPQTAKAETTDDSPSLFSGWFGESRPARRDSSPMPPPAFEADAAPLHTAPAAVRRAPTRPLASAAEARPVRVGPAASQVDRVATRNPQARVKAVQQPTARAQAPAAPANGLVIGTSLRDNALTWSAMLSDQPISGQR